MPSLRQRTVDYVKMLMWMNDVRAVKCDELMMMMMKCAIVCMKLYYNETKTVYRYGSCSQTPFSPRLLQVGFESDGSP